MTKRNPDAQGIDWDRDDCGSTDLKASCGAPDWHCATRFLDWRLIFSELSAMLSLLRSPDWRLGEPAVPSRS